MKKRNKVLLVALSAFVVTMLISAIGYYVFAVSESGNLNKPVFDLTASASGKYGVGRDISIKCKLDISTFYTNEKHVDFSNMKFVLNSNRAVSDKSGNLDNLAAGTIIYSESVSQVPNYRQEITGGKFSAYTHEFYLYFKVKELAKDKDGNELNVVIDDNLLKESYIDWNGQHIKFEKLNQTDCINVNVVSEKTEDVMPAISAVCKNVEPKESILDEKVDVTYQITANNFKYPNVTIGGTDTIVLLDNSDDNKQSESTVKNELWNKLSSSNKLRVGKDKFGLVSFSDRAIGYKTVPQNLRQEDKVPGKQDSEVAKGKAAYLTDYYNDFNDRILKSNTQFSEEEYRGVFYSNSKEKKIVDGFAKVKEIFDDKDRQDKAKGLPTTAKNIILIVSGNINNNYTSQEAEEIKSYGYNIFTIQINPKVEQNDKVSDDNSVEDFHKAIGGVYKDFHRNYKELNESHNFLMQIVATSISQAMPKKYEFKGFTLTFDLGNSFGKTAGAPTTDNSITITMDDNIKLEAKLEGDEYKPYWFIKNANGGYDPVTNDEKLQIHLEVYPKEVGEHLSFKKNGSFVHYNDVEGKPVKNLINDPDITVKDPATPRNHGLDNGTSGNSIIILPENNANIARGTNATILTYANVFARDVKLQLKIDPDLEVIGPARLCIFSNGGCIQTDSVNFDGVSKYMSFNYADELEENSKKNGKLFRRVTVNSMPDDWKRGDIVALKYMVRVPKEITADSPIGTEYNNFATYSRELPGLKTFKMSEPFTVIKAEQPNLF